MEKQSLDRQLDELREAGVEERDIYQEKMTGKRRDRPELNRMLDALQPQDTVVMVELTRLGRSTRDLMNIAEIIHQRGANFKSLNESWLDTTTPHGQLMFTFLAGMSQFERDLIVERTLSGLAAARARGRIGGRPSKQREKRADVEALYLAGMSMAAIVREMENISLSTVKRIIAEMKARRG